MKKVFEIKLTQTIIFEYKSGKIIFNNSFDVIIRISINL